MRAINLLVSLIIAAILTSCGLDPLTADDSPDKSKTAIAYTFRFGNSDTYVSIYDKADNKKIRVMKLRGTVPVSFKWTNDKELNVYIPNKSLIQNANTNIPNLKIDIVEEKASLFADTSRPPRPEHMASIIFAVSKRINDSIIVHYDNAKKINESVLKIVEDKLSSPFDLATRVAFCKEAFFLNDNDKDKPIGYLPQSANANPSTPMESLIFVTSELNPDNGEVLVFISSVSPARFTVFSIDRRYHINILYDSFQKNTLKDTTIGSVENITIVKTGFFRASERKDILNERLWPTPRQILISKDKDKFKIEFIGGNESRGGIWGPGGIWGHFSMLDNQ